MESEEPLLIKHIREKIEMNKQLKTSLSMHFILTCLSIVNVGFFLLNLSIFYALFIAWWFWFHVKCYKFFMCNVPAYIHVLECMNEKQEEIEKMKNVMDPWREIRFECRCGFYTTDSLERCCHEYECCWCKAGGKLM